MRLVHARLCGDGDAFCPRFMSAVRFWRRVLPWFMPAVRFWRRVLPSVHARRAVLATRLALAHACCLSCAKQDGLRYLAFLFRRVEIAIRAFSRCWRGYLPRWVHFGFVRFLQAISTGLSGNGVRGWRRGLCASLRSRIGTVVLSAGSTLGLRAPDCAKESSTLWTLFRGWPSSRVRFTRRGYVGAKAHPCKK